MAAISATVASMKRRVQETIILIPLSRTRGPVPAFGSAGNVQRFLAVVCRFVIIGCYKAVMPRYAAVDIGSNSVRMMAAEVTGAETRILAEDRQVTRLGSSVFRSGRISEDA